MKTDILFDPSTWTLIGTGTYQTLYMTIVSTIFAYLLGIPLGVVLAVTDKTGIKPNFIINKILGTLVNLFRSVPFIILLIAAIPLTRAILGTTLGSTATIVPLVLASAPYVGRMVESSLKETDNGIIEASRAMGATTWQIIYKVLLPESTPSLIVGGAIAITTILGYSAMAGFVGGGGLGDTAIRYGYYRYETEIMIITVVFMVIIVQIFQESGLYLSRRLDRRKK